MRLCLLDGLLCLRHASFVGVWILRFFFGLDVGTMLAITYGILGHEGALGTEISASMCTRYALRLMPASFTSIPASFLTHRRCRGRMARPQNPVPRCMYRSIIPWYVHRSASAPNLRSSHSYSGKYNTAATVLKSKSLATATYICTVPPVSCQTPTQTHHLSQFSPLI